MFKTFSFADLQRVIDYLYGGRAVKVLPYSYPFSIIALAEGVRNEQSLSILSNADFLCTSIRGYTEDNAVLNIIDSASNERWFDGPVPFEAIMSNAAVQHAFAWPRWVAANSTLQIQATGRQGGLGASDYALQGVLVYRY